MLTYAQVFRRSLKIAAGLGTADIVGALLSIEFGTLPMDVTGNLLLLEAAALFILAGIVDFGSSVGIVEFRRAIFSTKEEFSPSKRKDAERSALVFLAAGAMLFATMLLLTALQL